MGMAIGDLAVSTIVRQQNQPKKSGRMGEEKGNIKIFADSGLDGH